MAGWEANARRRPAMPGPPNNEALFLARPLWHRCCTDRPLPSRNLCRRHTRRRVEWCAWRRQQVLRNGGGRPPRRQQWKQLRRLVHPPLRGSGCLRAVRPL
eukprot:scaffold7789_cov376-Prasinococcus_capsulatus_cf.AAC.9